MHDLLILFWKAEMPTLNVKVGREDKTYNQKKARAFT